MSNTTRTVPLPEALVPYEEPPEGPRLPVLNVDLLRDLVLWAVQSYWEKVGSDYAPDWAQKYITWGRWNQGTWADIHGTTMETNGVATQTEIHRCQSSFCIAGNAVASMGYALLPDTVTSRDDLASWVGGGTWSDWNASYAAPRYFAGLDDKGHPKYEIDFTRLEGISEMARKMIGLHTEESAWLFDGSNEIQHIVDYAMRFAAIRGVNLNLPAEVENMAAPRLHVEDLYRSCLDMDEFWRPAGIARAIVDDGHLDDERDPFRAVRSVLHTAHLDGTLTSDQYQAAIDLLDR